MNILVVYDGAIIAKNEFEHCWLNNSYQATL